MKFAISSHQDLVSARECGQKLAEACAAKLTRTDTALQHHFLHGRAQSGLFLSLTASLFLSSNPLHTSEG